MTEQPGKQRLVGDAAGGFGCRDDEGGYVLALTALLMLPLLAFTGFAVDLGAWYSEAAKAQRTANAAALAAVTFLPDEVEAQDAAEAVLARNGYDPAQGVYTPINSQQYEVEITKTGVDQYFTSLFVDNVSVTRGARAEFIHEVALGSPRNFIGTYQNFSVASGIRENYSLSVNSPCSSREQGDYLLPVSHRNWNSPNPPSGSYSWQGCGGAGTTPSASFDGDGYFLAAEVPDTYSSGTFRIRAANPAHCPSGGTQGDWDTVSGNSFTTTFTVYRGSNNLLDPTDNPVVSNQSFTTTTSCSATNTSAACANNTIGWCTLTTINNPQPGQLYFIQVRTSDNWVNGDSQSGINSFSLAATPANVSGFTTSQACSGSASINVAAAPYSDQCIRLYAIRYLSLFTSLAATSPPTQPEFYLADIGPEHSNKTLEISLFDVGEGTISLEVLDPSGNPATFDYAVVDESGTDTPPFGGAMSGTGVNILDTRGTNTPDPCGRVGNPQAKVGANSGAKYNDRTLRLKIKLPPDIDAAYGGQTWWKVRYTLCAGGGSTDRTTWGAGVKGDPVRLIP